MIKEEYLEGDGEVLTDRKKRRTIRRIQEWEKFEENCLRFKENERRKRRNCEDGEIQRNSKEDQRKTVQRKQKTKREDNLPAFYSHEMKENISLGEKISLWREREENENIEEETKIDNI